MASGDRTVKILSLMTPTPEAGQDVIAEIRYRFSVTDKLGVDREISGGNLSLNLGQPAAALAMTLAQIRTAALNKINADGTVPGHDAAS